MLTYIPVSSIFGLTNRPQNRRQFLPWFQLLYDYPPPTGMTRTCIEMGRRGPSWNDWRMRCEEDPSAPFTGPFWLKSNNTSTKRHTTLKPTTASELTSYTNNYRQTLSQRPNPSQWRVSRRMQAQQTSTPSSNGFLNPLAVLTQMSKPASQTPKGKSATQDQIAQTTAADTAQQDRAWKLWMFLPRMLLHKPPGPAKIPKPELLSRFTAFFQGQWAELMQRSRDNRPQSQQPPATPQPTREPAADQRAHRANSLD